MVDPRQYFAAIEAAYGLPTRPMATPASPVVLDTLYGDDINGCVAQAAVMQYPDGTRVIGFAGTRTWEQWMEDANALPNSTRLGMVAGGIWDTYASLKTKSGVPLSTYNDARVGGHSRGAPMAALWAIDYLSPEYCLFASPRLIGSSAVQRLSPIAGMAFQMKGDMVPFLIPVYPPLPTITRVNPPKRGSVIYCHEFATYEATLNQVVAGVDFRPTPT